jgi:hypothetical protein
LDDRFLDSLHKSFLNQTTLDLRKEKWTFLNREFTVFTICDLKYLRTCAVRHYNPRLVYFKTTFGRQRYLFKGLFHKILALSTVSVQERFIIKSGL